MTSHMLSFRGKAYEVQEGKVHPAYSIACFTEEELAFREKYWQVESGQTVVDVGASYGAYALTAAACGARVIAFEPEPTVFVDLVANNKLNGNKCELYCAALGGEFGLVSMKDYAAHWPEGTVSCRFLAMPLDHLALTELHWLKIDVEGWECNVLKGARETITRCKPTVIVEVHTFMDEELLPWCFQNLYDLGYRVFEEVPRDPCVMLIARPK